MLAERLQLDLGRVTVEVVGPAPEAVTAASGRADLFVNASYASDVPSAAPRSMYVVHFPVVASEQPSRARRLLAGAGSRIAAGSGRCRHHRRRVDRRIDRRRRPAPAGRVVVRDGSVPPGVGRAPAGAVDDGRGRPRGAGRRPRHRAPRPLPAAPRRESCPWRCVVGGRVVARADVRAALVPARPVAGAADGPADRRRPPRAASAQSVLVAGGRGRLVDGRPPPRRGGGCGGSGRPGARLRGLAGQLTAPAGPRPPVPRHLPADRRELGVHPWLDRAAVGPRRRGALPAGAAAASGRQGAHRARRGALLRPRRRPQQAPARAGLGLRPPVAPGSAHRDDAQGWELHLVGGCEARGERYVERVRAAAEGLPVRART